jgi:sugar lactone lactonase YvrE
MLTDGGSLQQVSMGSFSPESVCVNSTDIYWPDTTDLIWDAPIHNPDGGANIVGLLFPLPNPIPFGSAVDDASFYYAGFSDAGTTPCPGYGCVLSFPLHGFGYTTVASGNFQPNGIALDSQHVYWTDVLNGQVMMADRTGLNPKTLATGQAGPAGIAVDPLNVYWANAAGGTIMMRPFDGGSIVTLAAGLSAPSRLVADSTNVYWTDHDAGTVARAPIAGGSTVILAAQQKGPIGIAQDATHIYWTDNGAALNTGTVMKVPK